MQKHPLLIGLFALSISACSTVTINQEGNQKLVTNPTYEQSQPFFFCGLFGEHRIDVIKICGGNEPVQMQSQQTLVDGLTGAPYDEAVNRLGSWSGMMAQAGHSAPADSFTAGDIKTAKMFGRNFSEALHRVSGTGQTFAENLEALA